MKKTLRVFTLLAALLLLPTPALAWHDSGHMVVAQVAYLRLTPAAKARVDALLVTPQGRRPLIHLCAGYFTAATCEKLYDPVTIAVWMDDFRGDSLNGEYDTWHYINYRPFFDGIPERTDVGPEPENVLGRINWAINTLRKGTGRSKTDAETLAFLYHLVGDVHQPLHATTRYTAALPDGDSGGNGFRITPPQGSEARSLHFFWDSVAGGAPGWESPKRPLDQAGRDRLRALADEVMNAYPANAHEKEWKDVEPLHWVEESNTLARRYAYGGIKEGETPSKAYTEQALKISRERIALAGYRLAEVLNRIFVEKPTPTPPATR